MIAVFAALRLVYIGFGPFSSAGGAGAAGGGAPLATAEENGR